MCVTMLCHAQSMLATLFVRMHHLMCFNHVASTIAGLFPTVSGTPRRLSILQDSPAKSGTVGMNANFKLKDTSDHLKYRATPLLYYGLCCINAYNSMLTELFGDT